MRLSPPGTGTGSGGFPFVNVDDPTGIEATDTALIEDAIAAAGGAGTLILSAGTYVCDPTTEWAQSTTEIVGQGPRVTTLKLADGADKDLIKGEAFDSLTGGASNGGVYRFALRNLSLDGNKANNTTGRGVAIFGYDNHFEDLEIHDFKGGGYRHEWGVTSAVSSDTLGAQMMENHHARMKVHRCEGGGIYHSGPSDSTFDTVQVAKNGPASSSTTVGVEVAGNAGATKLRNVHTWGLNHKYAYKISAPSCMVQDCEGEGASTAQLWILGGGTQVKGGWYFAAGATGDPPGIKIGETAGANPSDLSIDTKLTNCGIYFERGSGLSRIKLDVYWGNAAKTVITGTPSTTSRIDWHIQVRGGAKLGDIGVAGRRDTNRRQLRKGFPSGLWLPSGAISQSCPRQESRQNLGAPATSGRLFLAGGLLIPEGETVTSITFISGTTALATGSNQWFALYDAADPLNPALLAVTSDDGSAAWAASTPKTLNLSTPYTAVDDMQVYAGILVVASTLPTMTGMFTSGAVNIAPVLATNSTASLTNPASAPATAGNLTPSTNVPYVYLT